MQLTLPPDLEALVRRRLASGAFASPEDVVRRALHAQEEDEIWTEQEREALDSKIERSLSQIAAGQTVNPEEARKKLAALRAQHLATKG